MAKTTISEGEQEFPSMVPEELPPIEVSFRPLPTRRDPAIWVRKLSVWSAWPPSPATELRTITLHRGLNILWAESKDDGKQPRIGGHGAGKTTFCRFLRYILDERWPGTGEFRQDFRRIHNDGWVLAEVMINSGSWLVGKTLGERGRHYFAIRGADLSHPFDEQPPAGGYEEYRSALQDAALGRLPIRALSGSREPVKWVHLLAWLARDQEAHYANLLAWRDTASEPEGQDLSHGDRENLVRLVMGLLTAQPEQDKLSERAEAKVEHEAKVYDRVRLDFFRTRARNELGTALGTSVSEILGGRDAHVPDDPILLKAVDDQATQWEAETATAIREAGLDKDLQEAEDRVFKAALKTRDEKVALALLQRQLERLEPKTHGSAKEPKAETTNVEIYAAASRLEKMVGELRGLCNRSRDEAKELSCPHYKEPAPHPPTQLAISKQEERDDAAEANKRREIQELKAAVARQQSEVATAETAEKEVRDLTEKTKTFIALQRSTLSAPADRAAKLRQKLTDYRVACDDRVALEEEVTQWQKKKENLDGEIAKLAEKHVEIVGKFKGLFAAIAENLLGDGVEATVRLGKGITPTLQYGKRRRKSAALDVSTLLAFDLASLALGMTCELSHHPRFLIHDSPRESDLAIGIYHALFRTAQMLERASDGEPAFQYIVTTTEAPPADARDSKWLLQPTLDASNPKLRFLALDLG